MKLHGGSYDFNGSNSGIDLFHLTGWIPEQIFFEEIEKGDGASAAARRASDGAVSDARRRRPPVLDHRQPAERAWERLRSAFQFGDCLTTIATSGSLGEQEAEALGLVPGHAYAVLDVRECLGKRFLLVKNPWARKSWKGPFSAHDRARWTVRTRVWLRSISCWPRGPLAHPVPHIHTDRALCEPGVRPGGGAQDGRRRLLDRLVRGGRWMDGSMALLPSCPSFCSGRGISPNLSNQIGPTRASTSTTSSSTGTRTSFFTGPSRTRSGPPPSVQRTILSRTA